MHKSGLGQRAKMSPQSTGSVSVPKNEYQNITVNGYVRDEEDQVDSADEDDMFSELAFTLDDARAQDSVFLNHQFPDLQRTVEALNLREFQRRDFYCVMCERNDFATIDDLIDHIIPTHATDPTTVMNTGFFVCTLCYEKKHSSDPASTPPCCFLEAFDLALHVFKFHKSLAEGTRMKILLKMSAKVELVTMHRTYNDEQGDDGLWEYLECTEDDCVVSPAANREEEEVAQNTPRELSVADAPEPEPLDNLYDKPKGGSRPKDSMNKKRPRHLPVTKESSRIPAGVENSEDKTGNLFIDEVGSGSDLELDELRSSIRSGGNDSSDREKSVVDANETAMWVYDTRGATVQGLAPAPSVVRDQQLQPQRSCDISRSTERERDLIHHGRAIPTPAYRLKMKRKREELARAKKMIAHIKAAAKSEMVPAPSAVHRVHRQQEQQQQQWRQRQSVVIPQTQQWSFGQYHGTVTVQCPDSSPVASGHSARIMQKKTSAAASNPVTLPPPVIVRDAKKQDVPVEEDSPPSKLHKVSKEKGATKKRRAQIEEKRRKRIAGRAKQLKCVLHEDSEDPKAHEKISMHKLLAITTREVKKLRAEEGNLLEYKQTLLQKRAALQKRLVENQMLERSRTGLQRRLALL